MRHEVADAHTNDTSKYAHRKMAYQHAHTYINLIAIQQYAPIDFLVPYLALVILFCCHGDGEKTESFICIWERKIFFFIYMKSEMVDKQTNFV